MRTYTIWHTFHATAHTAHIHLATHTCHHLHTHLCAYCTPIHTRYTHTRHTHTFAHTHTRACCTPTPSNPAALPPSTAAAAPHTNASMGDAPPRVAIRGQVPRHPTRPTPPTWPYSLFATHRRTVAHLHATFPKHGSRVHCTHRAVGAGRQAWRGRWFSGVGAGGGLLWVPACNLYMPFTLPRPPPFHLPRAFCGPCERRGFMAPVATHCGLPNRFIPRIFTCTRHGLARRHHYVEEPYGSWATCAFYSIGNTPSYIPAHSKPAFCSSA